MSRLNRHRLNALMEREGFHALVASSPENVLYATGFVGLSHWIMRDVEVLAVIPRDPSLETALVAPSAEMDSVVETEPEVDVVYPYGEFVFFRSTDAGEELPERDARLAELAIDEERAPSAVDALARHLDRAGLTESVIGVDEVGIARSTLERIGGDRFTPAGGVWREARLVKTGEEVKRLRRAVEVTEEGFRAVVDALEEGISETDAHQVFLRSIVQNGATPSIAIIAFGAHGAFPNAVASARTLNAQDVVRFDIGCVVDGYHADIARTVRFGDATEKVSRYYQAILKGEEAGLERVRAGTTAEEIFEAAVDATRKAGIGHYQRNHVGHGIGLEIYDPPVLRAGEPMPLEAGMVINVETPYYEIGWAGIQVEDTVVVTEDGFELLTTLGRELHAVER